ncbi:MAG: tyrosine-type recombinase/integrase [Pirellulales bacterium]|nr:tyrosine-type recombinase/integrase [Pirellulales bacterium]
MPRKIEPIIGDPNDPRGMIAMLEQYLEWRRIKNYAEKTIELHRAYLRYFINWCAVRGVTQPAEVTKPIIERYQRYMYHYRKQNGDPLSFISQSGRLVPIRGWFRWMVRQNLLLYNPAADIDMPRLEHRLPKCVLTPGEVDQVINQCNVNNLLGLRDRAILETFYSTGIRRLEMINLRPYDLDAERGVLMVRQGKGKKDRVVPIGQRAVAWVDRYLIEVRPSLLIGDLSGEALFLNNHGCPFSREAMTQLCREYINAADLGKKGACHLFRHRNVYWPLE